MNNALLSDTPPSGGKRQHPLMNNFKESETFGYIGTQQFIAPHHLAPFSCTNCSTSNSDYSDLIKVDLLKSIADVSNSVFDLSQEIVLFLKANGESQNFETEFLPGTEHFVILDIPEKKKIHLKAKVRHIKKASSELSLSDSEWALLSNE